MPHSGGAVKVEVCEEAMDTEDEADKKIAVVERAQSEAAFQLLSKFTGEVVVRLKQYKDDLLAACLTFLLSLPHQVVSAQIHNLIQPLQVCVKNM